jgi:beta-glucosidase-like glycosyl hydrolase
MRLPLLLLLLTAACAQNQPAATPAPRDTVIVIKHDTIEAGTDSVLERKAARLQVQLLERDAQVADLRERLDDAIREVVRAMAKLQTVASRAEAASGMAEAELAYEAMRARTAARPPSEVAQAKRLLDMSTTEFNRQNYGGALYLATQVKGISRPGAARAEDDRRTLRAGEVAFATPLQLQLSNRGNLRDGPGTTFAIVATAEKGSPVTGYSYINEWVRVSDGQGRTGWIHQALLENRRASTP